MQQIALSKGATDRHDTIASRGRLRGSSAGPSSSSHPHQQPPQPPQPPPSTLRSPLRGRAQQPHPKRTYDSFNSQAALLAPPQHEYGVALPGTSAFGYQGHHGLQDVANGGHAGSIYSSNIMGGMNGGPGYAHQYGSTAFFDALSNVPMSHPLVPQAHLSQQEKISTNSQEHDRQSQLMMQRQQHHAQQQQQHHAQQHGQHHQQQPSAHPHHRSLAHLPSAQHDAMYRGDDGVKEDTQNHPGHFQGIRQHQQELHSMHHHQSQNHLNQPYHSQLQPSQHDPMGTQAHHQSLQTQHMAPHQQQTSRHHHSQTHMYSQLDQSHGQMLAASVPLGHHSTSHSMLPQIQQQHSQHIPQAPQHSARGAIAGNVSGHGSSGNTSAPSGQQQTHQGHPGQQHVSGATGAEHHLDSQHYPGAAGMNGIPLQGSSDPAANRGRKSSSDQPSAVQVVNTNPAELLTWDHASRGPPVSGPSGQGPDASTVDQSPNLLAPSFGTPQLFEIGLPDMRHQSVQQQPGGGSGHGQQEQRHHVQQPPMHQAANGLHSSEPPISQLTANHVQPLNSQQVSLPHGQGAQPLQGPQATQQPLEQRRQQSSQPSASDPPQSSQALQPRVRQQTQQRQHQPSQNQGQLMPAQQAAEAHRTQSLQPSRRQTKQESNTIGGSTQQAVQQSAQRSSVHVKREQAPRSAQNGTSNPSTDPTPRGSQGYFGYGRKLSQSGTGTTPRKRRHIEAANGVTGDANTPVTLEAPNGPPTFPCSMCGKVFEQKRARDQHTRTSHERSFPCDKCSASFKTKSDANRHIRIVHDRVRPFPCQSCNATFAERGKLRRHTQTVHEKLRPFTCQICGVSFGERGNLNQHHASRHAGAVINNSGASRTS